MSGITTRDATPLDLPELTRMMLSFLKSANHAQFGESAPADVEGQLAAVIDNGVIIVAVVDRKPVGMCALVATPIVFTRSVYANEVAWWVDPKHRGSGAGRAMLEAAEAWAKHKKARGILMSAITDGTRDVAEKAYRSRGYRFFQTSWVKEVQ